MIANNGLNLSCPTAISCMSNQGFGVSDKI